MDESIGRLIKIAHSRLNSQLDELAKPYGLTGVQMAVIDYLRSNSDEVTQKDIENEFQIQGSTVTVMIDRLEHKALVQRIKSLKDKRVNEIKLTEKGQQISNLVKNYIQDYERDIFSQFSEEENKTILKFLHSFEK
ncbi:MarR family winged helix-turn-helix transcriptional regulator [Fructobacillus tropaeoli]|jgi:DNA-binding MarR family transcriptional regulator|uniref:MarR family (MarR) n=1 Tax=Fructobacillus tropaeoli TaxID=709323 RepID=A0A3F3GZQ3_9LACO|nr:MarR family transcriptional regulator [Fructobacillus tropaeoli]GAP04441.1 transcriptional regulator [Fructobacillus tropaeoli]GIC70351.1 MarR family transcriptional regulator [Fructobacillus tropaeoli]CAK1242942.1 DNA-binding transcriptional regulator [Fructobacillus tropaeoli]CAK1243981.1 DNA-binding transcriptional regulator [Fructobacillus tropaeoli]